MDMTLENKIYKPEQVELVVPRDGKIVPASAASLKTVEVASESELEKLKRKLGTHKEPEIARFEAEQVGVQNWYEDTYWTHFDFRPDVKKAIKRVQAKFPYKTFANTYYCHPPVYDRTYEFVSVDYWGGGFYNGVYAGYRGKDINLVIDGWDVFNAIFNDPYLPNIAWIIYGGRMWTRGYGWGPAPYGPAGSDAGHYYHIHVTYVL